MTTPTAMPVMRLTKIVSRNVASSTAASPREVRSSDQNSSFSAMFQATTASTAPSAASGTKPTSGAATSRNSSR